MSFTQNKRTGFVISTMIFLIGSSLFLLVAIRLAVKLAPKEPMLFGGMQSGVPWSEILREALRNPLPTERQQFQQRGSDAKNKQVREGQVGHGPGRKMTVVDEAQGRFRQSLLAHNILANHEGIPTEKIWERVQSVPGEGPWRGYELSRLKTRILAEKFDLPKDFSVLPEYNRAAQATVKSPFANFEDDFYAGHAALFSGNVKKAEEYLIKARSAWPVKDTLYGFIHLFLTCIHAIRNEPTQAFEMMDKFQINFSDWLYTEIYMIEFETLETVYPNAPLITACHGRAYSFVMNDAKALAHYRRALNHRMLPSAAKARIRRWIDESSDTSLEGLQ